MSTFAESDHDLAAISAATQVAVPRSSRSQRAQALGILIGVFGILLVLALAVGAPLASGR